MRYCLHNRAMAENLQQTATEGEQARQVLDNPAFIEAFARMEQAIFDKWRAVNVRDPQEQALLLQMSKVADIFKAQLVGMVEQGKFASHKISLDAAREESRLRSGIRSFTGR